MGNPKVSVIVITHNEAPYISNCLKSVLNQSYENFEIIIVDEHSSDGTLDIVKSFKSRKIRLALSSSKNICVARNIGIKQARGEFVFFIDGDCIASRNWIIAAMKNFKDDVIGIEGKTYYVSKNFRPSLRDKIIYNLKGGLYATCNIAYKKKTLKEIGGFDEKFKFAGDIDLGLRAKKLGKIFFEDKMVVFHQRKLLSTRDFFVDQEKLKSGIIIIKKHYESGFYRVGRIVYPASFLMLFPAFVIIYLILSRRRLEKLSDLLFLPLYFIQPYFIRAVVWKTAVEEKIFLI